MRWITRLEITFSFGFVLGRLGVAEIVRRGLALLHEVEATI
ncbi:hypothetical protein ACIBKY_00340 [Nonomuraea sp. NPDC050394]